MRYPDIDNRRAVDEALEIGAECLVLLVAGLSGGCKDIAGAREQVCDGIATLLEYARPRGSRMAHQGPPWPCPDAGGQSLERSETVPACLRSVPVFHAESLIVPTSV